MKMNAISQICTQIGPTIVVLNHMSLRINQIATIIRKFSFEAVNRSYVGTVQSQERDILVTGGVFGWDKVLGAVSFDADSGKESLRFYPMSTKLDNNIALTRLHSQFGWPYPVPGKHVVDQLEKRFGSMRMSRSTASLNGVCFLESPLSKSTTRQKSELVNSIIPAEITDENDTLSIKEAKLRPLGYQDSALCCCER